MEAQCRFISGDKRFLLLPSPAFQLLLTGDCLPDIMEPLDKYENDRSSRIGETTRVRTFLMFKEAAIHIIRNADIVLAVSAT